MLNRTLIAIAIATTALVACDKSEGSKEDGEKSSAASKDAASRASAA